MKKAIKAIVSGTVQGVFFRAFVKEKADSLGIKGFVRNVEDGKVECYFEGDNEVIEKLMDEVRQGPQYSMIKNVDVSDEKYTGDYKDFRVLRF